MSIGLAGQVEGFRTLAGKSTERRSRGVRGECVCERREGGMEG